MPLAIALVLSALCLWDFGRRYLARDTREWREQLSAQLRADTEAGRLGFEARITGMFHPRATVDAAIKTLAEEMRKEIGDVKAKQIALVVGPGAGSNPAAQHGVARFRKGP